MKLYGLRWRLRRLEEKHQAYISPQVVLIGADWREDGEIAGAGICGKHIPRKPGEGIEQLTRRACKELEMQVLFAVFNDGIEAC